MLKVRGGAVDTRQEGYVPLSATRRAARRATLAGVGTAGSLIAAVAAIAAVAVGVVAFTGWPDSPSTSERAPVTLGGSARAQTFGVGESVSRVLAGTPGAAPSATAGPSTVTSGTPRPTDVAPVATPNDQAGNTGGGGAAASTSTGVTTDVTNGDLKPATSAIQPVVDAAQGGTSKLGDSVKTTADNAAQVARPLSDPLADAVAATGNRLGETVAAAGEAVSQVVSTLLPPPGT